VGGLGGGPVHAYQVGGATATGAIAVAQLVPAAIVAPLGSTLSERLPRSRALALAYGLLGLSMALLWITVAAGLATWIFVLMAVLASCAVTLCRPAHFATLPRLARSPEQLVVANSASSTLEGTGTFLGPLLVGLGVWLGGLSVVFAALFAIEAVAVVAILLTTFDLETEIGSADQGARDETWRGLLRSAGEAAGELRRLPGALTLLLLVGAQFVIIGMLDVLGVVLPQEAFDTGAGGASLVIGASGVGALIGAMATVVLVGRRALTPAFLVGFFGTSAALALVSVAPTLAVAVGLVGLSGFFRAFIDVAGRTLLQRTVDESVLVRVFGVQESVLMAGLAIGSAIAPLAISWLGVRGAFVVAGVLPALLAALGAPSLRRLDRRAHVPGPEFATVSRVELFRPLPQARLELLTTHAKLLEVVSGVDVVRQGEPGDRFYIVVDGALTVVRDGRPIVDLGPGDHFGEMALLRDAPRNATVTTTAASQLLAVERRDFLAVVSGAL
jgi:MFS family permease